MAISPGVNNGDKTNIDGVEYEWDGDKWNKVPTGIVGTLDTSEIALANPTKAAFNAIQQGNDLYPDTSGAITQEDANNLLVDITDWLRLHKNEVLSQSGLPDHLLYNDGALWVDTDTFDMFVLSGTQWIDLTALPDMSDYVKDDDLQFILQEYLRKRDAFDEYYQNAKLLHFVQPNGSFRVSLGGGEDIDNLYRRVIDIERNIIKIYEEIGNLGGDGTEVPGVHPDAQYIYTGGGSSDPGPGNFTASYEIDYWDQLNTLYISDYDLDGDLFDHSASIGQFIQIHRYDGDPDTGADFSCSAVFKVNSGQGRNDFWTLNVTVQQGSFKGRLQVGDKFSMSIIDEGTL